MSWIQFTGAPTKAKKTGRWFVSTNESTLLGEVKWFGRWRCYAFFPVAGTVFEKDCLRQIAEFCDEETRRHRQPRSG